MSLLKTIRAQLGLSVTPANNFTLDASADGGATPLKLTRNDGVDILTVDAAGKVGFPQNAQTWQDMTASRLLAGSYTNSTGQPIDIAVSCANAGSSGATGFAISVAGVVVAQTYIIQQTSAGNYFTSLYARVPSGASYNLVSGVSVTLAKWMELR